MKTYPDIEQSKKLEGILPPESADHHYVRKVQDSMGKPVDGKWSTPKYGNPNSSHANYMVMGFTKFEIIPCWSLVALLELIPKEADIHKDSIENEIFYSCGTYGYGSPCYDNPIDAIFSMVVWLKENGKI